MDIEAEGTAYMGWMEGKVGTVDTADVANSVGCSCTYDQGSIRSEDIGGKYSACSTKPTRGGVFQIKLLKTALKCWNVVKVILFLFLLVLNEFLTLWRNSAV